MESSWSLIFDHEDAGVPISFKLTVTCLTTVLVEWRVVTPGSFYHYHVSRTTDIEFACDAYGSHASLSKHLHDCATAGLGELIRRRYNCSYDAFTEWVFRCVALHAESPTSVWSRRKTPPLWVSIWRFYMHDPVDLAIVPAANDQLTLNDFCAFARVGTRARNHLKELVSVSSYFDADSEEIHHRSHFEESTGDRLYLLVKHAELFAAKDRSPVQR